MGRGKPSSARCSHPVQGNILYCVSRALRGGRGKEEPLGVIAMVLQLGTIARETDGVVVLACARPPNRAISSDLERSRAILSDLERSRVISGDLDVARHRRRQRRPGSLAATRARHPPRPAPPSLRPPASSAPGLWREGQLAHPPHFECRAGSSPCPAVEMRGTAWPLPSHLLCVENPTPAYPRTSTARQTSAATRGERRLGEYVSPAGRAVLVEKITERLSGGE